MCKATHPLPTVGQERRVAESTVAGVDSTDEGDEEYPRKSKPVNMGDTEEH